MLKQTYAYCVKRIPEQYCAFFFQYPLRTDEFDAFVRVSVKRLAQSVRTSRVHTQ
jgi:hypothetical protein